MIPDAMSRARALLRHPAFGALLLWGAFMLTRKDVWGMTTRLSASTFEGFSILGRALMFPRQGVMFGVLLVFAVLSLRVRWDHLAVTPEQGQFLRRLMGVLVVAQAWVAALYEYNLLVDRAHVVDRLVVLALAGLSLWRPAFVPVFVTTALIVIAQAAVGLNALGWTNMRLFLDALILFSCFIVLHRVLKVGASSFFFVLLAVIGAAYFGPAIDKLQLGPELWTWHTENDVANIAAAGYANGWLPWLGDAVAATVVRGISFVAPVLGMGTFLIEAAAVTVFLHRRIAMVVCAGVFLLHAGIFVLTGILFWKWMLVDAGTLLLLWKHPGVFTMWPLWMRLAGTVFIALTPWTFQPQQLAWWDSRFNQVMTVEVQDDTGEWRPMSPLTYAPFDLPFAQQRFNEVLDVPKKVGTFGATTSTALYRKLQAAKTPDDINRIFKSTRAPGEGKKAAAFDTFIVRTAQTLNTHQGDPPLSWLPHAPAHIIVVRADAWDGQPITAARVRLREILFDGTKFVTLDDRIVRDIQVSKGLAQKAAKTAKGVNTVKTAQGAKPPAEVVVRRKLTTAVAHEVIDRGADMVFAGACDAKRAADDIVTIALLADMKLHKPVSEQALNKGYDSLWAADVKKLVRAADLAYANMEGTLACCIDVDGNPHADPGKRWDNVVYTSSGKGLNFHPGLATALADLGVDVMSTANNHSLDRLGAGVTKTIDVLAAAGVKHSGTRRSGDEPWHAITEAKGMRIAWLACAEWTNRKDQVAAEQVLNCTEERDEVLDLVKQLAADPKIDAVIVTPHGSMEDRILPDERLRTLARDVAEAGATVVASSHPHNLQTWEKLTTRDGREVPLIYGRGNYITFANGIENITSTIVHVGLVKGPSGKVIVRGVVHTPIYLVPSDGERSLVFVEGDAKLGNAWRMITSRFGNARLHPPTLPIDVTPECSRKVAPAPAAAAIGEACIDDTMCAAELMCAPHAKGIGLCTRACTDASPCGDGAACVDDDVLGERACLQTCTADDLCRLMTKCVDRAGAKVCAPAATAH